MVMQVTSRRGTELASEPERVGFARHFAALDDLFEVGRNPDGWINMGASETHLLDGQLAELITDASRSKSLTPADLHYALDHGSPKFRSAIAKFLSERMFRDHRSRTLTAENIVVTIGATGALDMLAHVLGDPGDIFLVPVPMYASFEFDLGRRAGIHVEPVDAGRDLSIEAFDVSLRRAQGAGERVRCVLLSSPNNPTGTVYDATMLSKLAEFCHRNDLALVCDEIYSQTVFGAAVQWSSIHDVVADADRARVVSIGGFAKDFGLSGFKVGFVASVNDDVNKALRNLAYFSPVSTLTQFVLTNVLESGRVDLLIKANRDTLRHAHQHVVDGLGELGIQCMPAMAGAFVMADFGSFLPDRSFAAEAELVNKLHLDLKVNLAPGQAYHCSQPGWIRICYAQSDQTIDELLRRISLLRRPSTRDGDVARADRANAS